MLLALATVSKISLVGFASLFDGQEGGLAAQFVFGLGASGRTGGECHAEWYVGQSAHVGGQHVWLGWESGGAANFSVEHGAFWRRPAVRTLGATAMIEVKESRMGPLSYPKFSYSLSPRSSLLVSEATIRACARCCRGRVPPVDVSLRGRPQADPPRVPRARFFSPAAAWPRLPPTTASKLRAALRRPACRPT